MAFIVDEMIILIQSKPIMYYYIGRSSYNAAKTVQCIRHAINGVYPTMDSYEMLNS